LNKDAGFLPDFVARKVRENSRHLTKNEEIVIQADGARSQRENIEEAYRRLHKILVECVSVDVPGVTGAEKKQRVKELYRLPSPASPSIIEAKDPTANPSQSKAGRPTAEEAEDDSEIEEGLTAKQAGRRLGRALVPKRQCVCICVQ